MAFTHLEVHSHFTLLGGTASPAALTARAAADGLSHLALTDTAVLSGAVAFRKACWAAGVQPVIGMVVPAWDEPGRDRPPRAPGRLVLLAKDREGYRSLCRLSALLQGAVPREAGASAAALGWDDLRAHRQGLICLSGGQAGWVHRYLQVGDRGAAQVYAGRLAGLYGEDACLAIELPAASEGARAARPAAADLALAREAIALGQRVGMAAVAVQPIYSLEPGQARRLRLLAAVRGNCLLEDVPPEELPGHGESDVHWPSPDEMALRYAQFPGLLAMAGQIAGRCGDALPDGRRPVWPAVPPDILGQAPDGSADGALAAEAQSGLAAKYGPEPPLPVVERLSSELAAIARHGYAPLFLVVADMVRHARRQGIPVSTRGSVANSLVAYCAGITDVDPVAHDLLFERFLSPARIDPPDIDIDACSRRRDEILDYVRRRHGGDRVALVGSVSTLRVPSAVRAAAKAHGLGEEETGRLLASLPHVHPYPGARRDTAALAEFLADGAAGLPPAWRAVLDDALLVAGQPDHMSIHAGGLVITPCPLTDLLPVQLAPKGFLITQYEHGDLEALGLPKIDLLGIRALTVLADAVDMVREHYEPAFRLEEIPLDDALTGDLLAAGETIGVFQCESDGARATLRKLQARTPRDLAVANAFFKPGPSAGGMATAFVRRHRGDEEPQYLHPALEPIVGSTKGVLLFQEQVLRIARELAGLSWEEADHLRRGMGRMQPAEMAALRERFLAGCQRQPPEGAALSAGQAATLWEQVAAFAGFGFNQGHATAYAAVSYRSAYMRAHWPAAFLCARLADFGGFHHPAIYMAEAVRIGIAVRPPHVNHSRLQFTLEAGAGAKAPSPGTPPGGQEAAILWMGLGQVRDLRASAVEAIVRGREEGPYASLRDLTARVSLQPKELRHLIQCGALDGLGASRAALLAEAGLPGAGGRAERHGRRTAAQQLAFDFALPQAVDEAADQRCAWETEVLGIPVTALASLRALLPQAATGQGPLPEAGALAAALAEAARATRRRAVSGRVAGAGVRLPGWTGGPGFPFWDGRTLVTARLPKAVKAPPPWQMFLAEGRAVSDGWGTAWWQVDELKNL